MKVNLEYDRAYMSRTYDPGGWNLLHGIFRLPDTFRSFFEIEYAPSQTDFIVDHASFTKMPCDINNLLLNGNLEQGNSKYWDTWGGETGLEIVVGHGGTGHALKSFQRKHYSHGQAQVLNLDCIHNGESRFFITPFSPCATYLKITPFQTNAAEGDRLGFEAKVKFEVNGVTVPCNPFTWNANQRCSDIWMYTDKITDEGNRREYHRVALVTTSEYDSDNGW